MYLLQFYTAQTETKKAEKAKGKYVFFSGDYFIMKNSFYGLYSVKAVCCHGLKGFLLLPQKTF